MAKYGILKFYFLILLIFFSFILVNAIGVFGVDCRNDAECPMGERCDIETRQCMKSCDTPLDCPLDKRSCEENICRPCHSNPFVCPFEYPCSPQNGECVPKQCSNDGDCGQSGSCIGGFCAVPCPTTDFCVNYLEPNQICLGSSNSYCYKEICAKDNDCPDNFDMKCTNKKCVKPCEVSSDCDIFPEIYLCNFNTKTCERSKTCNSPNDCKGFGSVYTCTNNLCMEDCSLGGNCPVGTNCHYAEKKCGFSVSCNIDADCIPYGLDYMCNVATHECQKEDCTISGCSNPALPFCNPATKKCGPKSCNTNYDCTLYSSCDNGVCSPTKSCLTNAECNGYKCDTLCNAWCKDNDVPCDTASGYQCDATAQKCIKPVQIYCATEADCPPGKSCIGGVCGDETGCSSNNDCQEGYECKDGSCELKPIEEEPPEGCTDDTGCDGYICGEGGECKTSCSADDDCQSDYECKDGSCELKPIEEEPPEGCTDDTGCTTPEKCVNSECIDTTAQSCVELGGITCESGYACDDTSSKGVESLTSSACCIANTGEKAECISMNAVFVPSQASEVFVKKGACINGKREVQYCPDKDNCEGEEKSTEDCTAITRKGSSTEIPAFGLYAGVIALILIIIYYLVFYRREKKNIKKKKIIKKKVGERY